MFFKAGFIPLVIAVIIHNYMIFSACLGRLNNRSSIKAGKPGFVLAPEMSLPAYMPTRFFQSQRFIVQVTLGFKPSEPFQAGISYN